MLAFHEFTDYFDVEPVNYLIILGCLIYLGVYWIRSRKGFGDTFERWSRRDLYPAEAFLEELSKGGTVGNDKRLIAMLHSSLLAVSEKGVIKGLARCVTNTHGAFVALDIKSLRVAKNENSCHVVGRASFSLLKEPVPVEISWIQSPEDPQRRDWAPWSIVSFNISSPSNQPMHILSFVEPSDFASFGERVARSLVNRTPSFAYNVMVEPLRNKYVGPSDIAAKIAPVMASCGGLRDRYAFYCDLASARVSDAQERVELVFRVEGLRKDLRIELFIIVADMQCFLARYNVASEPKSMALTGRARGH